MKQLVNCNAVVRVRLTIAGELIHHRRLSSIRSAIPHLQIPDMHQPDAEGWREYQLWELMHDFGNDMFNGCDIPFVDNVIEFLGREDVRA